MTTTTTKSTSARTYVFERFQQRDAPTMVHAQVSFEVVGIARPLSQSGECLASTQRYRSHQNGQSRGTSICNTPHTPTSERCTPSRGTGGGGTARTVARTVVTVMALRCRLWSPGRRLGLDGSCVAKGVCGTSVHITRVFAHERTYERSEAFTRILDLNSTERPFCFQILPQNAVIFLSKLLVFS